MHILMVEDDADLADTLTIGLEGEGYTCTAVRTGEDALSRLATTRYDLVLLDVELPGASGLDVLDALSREKNLTPVVIMSGGRREWADRVKGLDGGADDYLVKPFEFDELLARIRAVLRRTQGGAVPVLRVADLVIDLEARRVTRAGREVELTPRELELLTHLVRHAGRVVTREELATEIWRQTRRATPLDNVLDVHVSNLRKKLDDGFDVSLLRTVRGEGFVLDGGDEGAS